jgi:hypothetical protein
MRGRSSARLKLLAAAMPAPHALTRAHSSCPTAIWPDLVTGLNVCRARARRVCVATGPGPPLTRVVLQPRALLPLGRLSARP